MGIGVAGSAMVMTLSGYKEIRLMVGSTANVLSLFADNTSGKIFNGFAAAQIVPLGVQEVCLINTTNPNRFLRVAPEQLVMTTDGPKKAQELKVAEDMLVPFGNVASEQIVEIIPLKDEQLFNVKVKKTKNCIVNGLTILNA